MGRPPKKGNHKKDKVALAGTVDVAEVKEDLPPEVPIEEPPPEKQKPQKVVDVDDFSDAYKSSGTTDLLSSLLQPGENALNLLMKANIMEPRQAVAFARDLESCNEFGDVRGADECKMVLAGLCGVGAERAQLVADTYALAEKQKRYHQGQGAAGWLQEKVDTLQGNKKEGKYKSGKEVKTEFRFCTYGLY